MITFLAHIIKFYLPLALMAGALLGMWHAALGKKMVMHLGWGVACGLVAGIVAYSVAGANMLMTEYNTALHGINILIVAVTVGMAFLPSPKKQAMRLAATAIVILYGLSAAALASFSFATFAAEQALSTTVVLNTEFILNLGALLAGTLIIVSLTLLTARISRINGRFFSLLFLVGIAVFPLLTGAAETMLGIMKLGFLELTSLRLSFVGKVVGFSYIYPYLELALFAAIAVVFFLKRPQCLGEVSVLNRARLRKERARVLFELRFFKAALLLLCLLAVPLLYYDLYASQPPKLSKATPVVPDTDGMIRIPVDGVKDGELHRYAYITSDGQRVRFFLINRHQDHVSIAVVFDACIICGDMGYIQAGGEVICIACNVRMFTPSIGKAGGCNPIPMEHTVQGGAIVIAAAELDRGATYFSEVVELKVHDPVTGTELSNLKAPHQYDYKGRTYFFEGIESFEKFKASPESYVGGG